VACGCGLAAAVRALPSEVVIVGGDHRHFVTSPDEFGPDIAMPGNACLAGWQRVLVEDQNAHSSARCGLAISNE
jgi:hypothetical protein